MVVDVGEVRTDAEAVGVGDGEGIGLGDGVCDPQPLSSRAAATSRRFNSRLETD
jgi:hypothetical protein